MGEIIRYKCPNCSRKFAFSEGIGMNYPLACADILERIINRRNMNICDDGARIKELALAAKRPAIAYYDGYFTCDDCDNVEGGRMSNSMTETPISL